MATYDEMVTDFSQRTKSLVKGYKGKYNVTLLINCCLGLIVLPKEKYFKLIPDEEIPIEGELWGLTRETIQVRCKKCGYNLRHVIRRIRNGICHFRIKSIPNEEGQIAFLDISDGEDFSATLAVDNLRKLAFSLAENIHKHKPGK